MPNREREEQIKAGSDNRLTHRSIYPGQRVWHPIAGFGRVVKLGRARREHTATIQYEAGPINPHDGLPPRGLAYIRELEDADDA